MLEVWSGVVPVRLEVGEPIPCPPVSGAQGFDVSRLIVRRVALSEGARR